MEKTNDEKIVTPDYDVASEDIVNFIDELIVKKISEKIEEQKSSTDKTVTDLKSMTEKVDRVEEYSEKCAARTKNILKLLLENIDDMEILEDENYSEYDIVKHSEWEKESIEKLLQMLTYDSNSSIFEHIMNENNRIEGEIIKEISAKLAEESVSQNEKNQKIWQLLLNPQKQIEEFVADEYYDFDIVEKVNSLEKLVNEIIKQESLFEEKITNILIRNDGDRQPDYFDQIEKEIGLCIENSNSELVVLFEKFQEKTLEEGIFIKSKLDDCGKKEVELEADINLLSQKIEEKSKNELRKAQQVEKKICVVGGIMIFLQIISILLFFLS